MRHPIAPCGPVALTQINSSGLA